MIVPVQVRVPDTLRDKLREKYWSQAGAHKQSYNAWLTAILEKAAK